MIIPLVTVILCNIDVGQNLNTVNDNSFGNIWFQLFEDVTFMSDLTYDQQMFSVSREGFRSELKEFAMSSAVAAGVKLQFPFSWILKKKLNEILETATPVPLQGKLDLK